MANADRGVVIYDAQHQNAGKVIVNYCGELRMMIDDYCNCIQKITELAINDRLISSRLMNVREKMIDLKTPLSEIAESVKKDCGAHIKDIDSADQFLY